MPLTQVEEKFIQFLAKLLNEEDENIGRDKYFYQNRKNSTPNFFNIFGKMTIKGRGRLKKCGSTKIRCKNLTKKLGETIGQNVGQKIEHKNWAKWVNWAKWAK